MQPFEQFLQDVDRATWTESLWRLFLEFCAERGLDMVSYHHMPPLGAADEGKVRVVANGFPEDWFQRYVRQKYFRIDPYPAYAFRVARPFLWSDLPPRAIETEAQRAMMHERKAFDLGDGLAIPLFGPGGRNGFIALGFGAQDHARALGEATVLQAAASAAHLRYCTLLRENLPEPPQLSTREMEILEWVARGKSNSVIADILGLSTHTVDAYLRRVFAKLGTADRLTAAIRGLGMGVIQGFVA